MRGSLALTIRSHSLGPPAEVRGATGLRVPGQAGVLTKTRLCEHVRGV